MARSSLRILGIGDAKSRHFARWATRLAERGPRGARRVRPRQPARGRARRPRRPPVPGSRSAAARAARAALPDGSRPRRARAARAAGRRPLALPPAVRLLDGARRARAARRQPVGEGRDRRRLAVARGRGARARGDRAGARSRVRRQLAGARGRVGPARRRPREVPPHLLARAHRRLLAASTPTAAAGSALGWPDDAVVCLSLRNFRPYSNLDIVLRAFAKAQRGRTGAAALLERRRRLDRDEFDRLAAELGVEPYMAVRDVPAAELPSVTASADFAVTLADVDSSPASLLETMASGVPLVVGRAPSMDEWIQQGEGGELVDDRHDVDAVAAGDGRASPATRSCAAATASGTSARCTRASATRPPSSSRSTARCSAGEARPRARLRRRRLRPRPAPHGRGEAARRSRGSRGRGRSGRSARRSRPSRRPPGRASSPD